MKLSAAESSLLNARERDLLKSDGPWEVKDLVKVIKRVRDLRDKQRQLTQRQKIATGRRTGSKSGTSGAANARTAEKGRIFDRALKHFEGKLERINTESSDAAAALDVGGAKATVSSKPAKKTARKVAKKAARKASKAPAKKTAAKKGAAKKGAAKKGAAKKGAARKATAKKSAAKKGAAKKATAKKSTAKKAAAKKSAAKKAPAKKAAAKKAGSKKAVAKKPASKASKARKSAASKSPAKKAPAKKAAAKKTIARKIAKAAKAKRKAPPPGPVQAISDKARLNLPKGSGGHVDSQVHSLPSLKSRAKRAR